MSEWHRKILCISTICQSHFIQPSSVACVRRLRKGYLTASRVTTNNWFQYTLICGSLPLFFFSRCLFGFCSGAKKLYNWLFSWLFITHVRDERRERLNMNVSIHVLWAFDFHLDMYWAVGCCFVLYWWRRCHCCCCRRRRSCCFRIKERLAFYHQYNDVN